MADKLIPTGWTRYLHSDILNYCLPHPESSTCPTPSIYSTWGNRSPRTEKTGLISVRYMRLLQMTDRLRNGTQSTWTKKHPTPLSQPHLSHKRTVIRRSPLRRAPSGNSSVSRKVITLKMTPFLYFLPTIARNGLCTSNKFLSLRWWKNIQLLWANHTCFSLDKERHQEILFKESDHSQDDSLPVFPPDNCKEWSVYM